MKKLLPLAFLVLFGCQKIEMELEKIPTISQDTAHKIDTIPKKDSILIKNPIDTLVIDTNYNPIKHPTDSIKTPVDSIYKPIEVNNDVNSIINISRLEDLITYKVEVQNISKENITVTNYHSQRNVFWDVYKDETLYLNKWSMQDFTLTINPKGYFGLEQTSDKIRMYLSNAEFYGDKNLTAPEGIEMSVKQKSSPIKLTEKGKYYIEFKINYSISGNDKTIKIKSDEFEY